MWICKKPWLHLELESVTNEGARSMVGSKTAVATRTIEYVLNVND
jgi:hypothetical protein